MCQLQTKVMNYKMFSYFLPTILTPVLGSHSTQSYTESLFKLPGCLVKSCKSNNSANLLMQKMSQNYVEAIMQLQGQFFTKSLLYREH